MDLKLQRLQFNPPYSYCLGSLFVNGEWECFTREPAVRHDGVFIAGESALPAGLYTVSLPQSRVFGRVVPLLVSSRLIAHGGKHTAMGMRFLPGHHMVDAECGITVGQKQGPKDVHHTKAAYEALFEKLETAVRGCEAIELEIT